MSHDFERRGSTRFDVDPIVCHGLPEPRGLCVLKNVSVHGALFLNQVPPPVGRLVELEFSEPPLEGYRIIGKVIRHTNDRSRGFVVQFQAALSVCDSDQRGTDGLGDRLNLVQVLWTGSAKIMFIHDIAVARQDDGLKLAEIAPFNGVGRTLKGLRRQPRSEQQKQNKCMNFHQFITRVGGPE